MKLILPLLLAFIVTIVHASDFNVSGSIHQSDAALSPQARASGMNWQPWIQPAIRAIDRQDLAALKNFLSHARISRRSYEEMIKYTIERSETDQDAPLVEEMLNFRLHICMFPGIQQLLGQTLSRAIKHRQFLLCETVCKYLHGQHILDDSQAIINCANERYTLHGPKSVELFLNYIFPFMTVQVADDFYQWAVTGSDSDLFALVATFYFFHGHQPNVPKPQQQTTSPPVSSAEMPNADTTSPPQHVVEGQDWIASVEQSFKSRDFTVLRELLLQAQSPAVEKTLLTMLRQWITCDEDCFATSWILSACDKQLENFKAPLGRLLLKLAFHNRWMRVFNGVALGFKFLQDPELFDFIEEAVISNDLDTLNWLLDLIPNAISLVDTNRWHALLVWAADGNQVDVLKCFHRHHLFTEPLLAALWNHVIPAAIFQKNTEMLSAIFEVAHSLGANLTAFSDSYLGIASRHNDPIFSDLIQAALQRLICN